MSPFTLMLEGCRDRQAVTASQVESAIERMAQPNGPTWITLKDPHGAYAEAMGCDDRYRIEARETWGEGFRHWLAASPHVKDRSDVVMYYRNNCKVHGRRKCPLPAWGENVLALADVRAIMLFYHAAGERNGTYPWEDVTRYCIEAGLKGDMRFIREIRPRQRHGHKSSRVRQ